MINAINQGSCNQGGFDGSVGGGINLLTESRENLRRDSYRPMRCQREGRLLPLSFFPYSPSSSFLFSLSSSQNSGVCQNQCPMNHVVIRVQAVLLKQRPNKVINKIIGFYFFSHNSPELLQDCLALPNTWLLFMDSRQLLCYHFPAARRSKERKWRAICFHLKYVVYNLYMSLPLTPSWPEFTHMAIQLPGGKLRNATSGKVASVQWRTITSFYCRGQDHEPREGHVSMPLNICPMLTKVPSSQARAGYLMDLLAPNHGDLSLSFPDSSHFRTTLTIVSCYHTHPLQSTSQSLIRGAHALPNIIMSPHRPQNLNSFIITSLV